MPDLTVTAWEDFAVDDHGGASTGPASLLGTASCIGTSSEIDVTALISAADLATLPDDAIIDSITVTVTHAFTIGTMLAADVQFGVVVNTIAANGSASDVDPYGTGDHAGTHVVVRGMPGITPHTVAGLATVRVGWFLTGTGGALAQADNTTSAFDATVQYHVPPYVVVPAIGGVLGADPVTITGARFDEGITGVTFDGTAATDVVVVNDTTLTCVTPAHAVGVVDVVLTRTDTTTRTLVDGFTYQLASSTPTVDAGQAQIATGPLPSIVTTDAVVTRGQNNGTLTYAWSQVSGPATATISAATSLDTDLTFDAFVPGVYVFELAATTEGALFTATGTLTVIMGPTVPPRVTSGRVQQVWSDGDTVTLSPVVVDDGWGGDLTYAWTQLSGPATATIADAASLETDVTFPDVDGAYVFAITVTRADDALVGSGRWRVYVLAAGTSPDEARGAITVFVNGDAVPGLANSVRISEQLHGADTCQFSQYVGRIDDASAAVGIAVFNEVMITRHNDVLDTDVRLFAGVCLSRSLSIAADRHLMVHPSLVGYAWHLGRVRVTRTYTNWPIGTIALDLLARAPGGLSGAGVASGLPYATINFDDEPIDAALTRLVGLERDLHWRVDYFKTLHLTYLENDGAAPLAWSLAHPSLHDLTITDDGSQVVNQVRVYYTTPVPEPDDVVETSGPPAPIIGTVQPGDTEIQVESLDGYSPAGGTFALNGSLIHYSGTRADLLDSVLRGVFLGYVTLTPRLVEDGEFDLGGYTYYLTLMTAEGETPAVYIKGAAVVTDVDLQNAMELVVLNVRATTPAVLRRLTGINVYRQSAEPPHAGDTDGVFLVGSLGARGGTLVDKISKAHLAPLQLIPSVNTADVQGFWLEGVTITKPIPRTPGTPIRTYVEVEDTGAQADLATRLGTGGSGVIAMSFDGGSIGEAEARALALDLLRASTATRLTTTGSLRDDRAHPGEILSLNFAAPIDVQTNLKIQQATLSLFDDRLPHAHSVTAAIEVVTLADLLKDRS